MLAPQTPGTNLLSLTAGDDYTVALGRALTWSAGDWANLTGATINFVWRSNIRDGEHERKPISGTITAGGAGTQIVQVEIPNSATQDLDVGKEAYSYEVRATIAGEVETLVEGQIDVDGHQHGPGWNTEHWPECDV